MSTVKLPSTTKKRQKGVVAQPTKAKPRQIAINQPGKSVGSGPGQGKMEGEGIDVLEQHRLDTMQAPPLLRVEQSPPPPGLNVRGRGGVPARGRGGVPARGRGRGAARGGRGSRGTGVVALPGRGDGGWGARGSGTPPAGPSHMSPMRPPPQSFGQMPTGVIPRPPGMGSPARPQPSVHSPAAGPSGSSLPGPSRQIIPSASAPRPTYPSLRPVVLLSNPNQPQTRSASHHSERKPNIPAQSQNGSTSSTPPVQTMPRTYAPAGAYARVIQNRDTAVTNLADSQSGSSQPAPSAHSTVKSTPRLRVPSQTNRASPQTTPHRDSSPSYSPQMDSDFIIRDEDAYSPSRPSPMDIDADDLGSEMQTGSKSKKAQGKQRETQSTSDPDGRRDNPVDVDLGTDDDDDAEQEVFVPVAPPTQPIVDYTSQVKIESGCTDDINELDNEEEAEPEPEDDNLKQSSTLLWSKSSGRSELEDCWSGKRKTRTYARVRAYCAATNELSKKDRRGTSCIWRDDGFAVDWVLDHQEGAMHVLLPQSLTKISPSNAVALEERNNWIKKQMTSLRNEYPYRFFFEPSILLNKIKVVWTSMYAPSMTGGFEEIHIIDQQELFDGTPPRNPSGKRPHSPSPVTARKAVKTSTISSPNAQIQQTGITDYDAIVPVAEDHRRERLPVGPVERTLPVMAAHLEAALQDLDPWKTRCLPGFIRSNPGLHPLRGNDHANLSKKHHKGLITFTRNFLKILDKREFRHLPNLYHQNCSVSLVPTQGESQRFIPDGEPGLNFYRAMGKQSLSNRDYSTDAIGTMRYSDIVETHAITQYLIRNRAKKTGLRWISFQGFLGSLHLERHFLWSYRRTMLVMVEYVESGLPKKSQIVADYMITKRHGEAPLPSGWHWISEPPPVATRNDMGDATLEVGRATSSAPTRPNKVAPPDATDTNVNPVTIHLPTQSSAASKADGRASQQSDPIEQKQQQDNSESGHSAITMEEGDEDDDIPSPIEGADRDAGEDEQIGTVGPTEDDEQESLQRQMETALEQQDTWQEIRAAAPNARAAVKKLAELEEEIVALHMRLVALRKRSTSQPQVLAIEPPTTKSSTTSTTATGEVSDLKLAGGIAHPFSRMAGDKIRFMLKGPTQIQSCDIAVYSMRGVAQHISDKPANAKSRAVSTILENGLRVVDGCMPTSGKVVMVVERNAVVPVSKNPQQLLLWDQDEQGTPRQAFLPRAPHTGNPSCVVSIGYDEDGGYRFASGGTTDRKVVLWDIQNSGAIKTSVIQHHSSAIRSLAFDAVHGQLFGGTTSGRILIQNLEHQQSAARSIYVNAAIFHLHTNPLLSHQSIAVEAEQTRDQFYVYDMRGSSKQPTHRFGYDINAIPKATLSRFDKGSFEGNYFARGYGDGTVRMWDLRMVGKKANRENPYMVAKASNDPIRHVVLDGRKLRVLTQTAVTTYDVTTQT